MTNTINKVIHNGDEYELPEWFSPESVWTTWDVLTKTANGYEWTAPSGWDVLVSDQPNNILTTWMKIRAWTDANYQSLWSRNSNTLYLTVE